MSQLRFGFYTTDRNHLIEADTAGFNSRLRLTCHNCGATLVRQPYMTGPVWQNECDKFDVQHGEIRKESYTKEHP